jgi:hypothetical protein
VAKPKPKPKTPQQRAQELVQQVLGPQIKASNQAYANQGASQNAAYQAAAQLQQQVAPQIQQGYDAASSREAVIAKGLQVGAQLAGQETSGASNALLAQNNSPQQVKAADIGAPLATLGGMSAQNLNQQGAAFGAAARFLPTQSLNLGIDAIKQSGLQGMEARNALEAQRPGLVTQARGQLSEEAARNEGLRQNEIALRAKLGDAEFDRNVTVERLKNDRARIALSQLQSDRNFNLSLERLGIQDSGLRLRAAELELKRRKKPGVKGGFTAKQRKDLKADAGALARNAYQGLTVVDEKTGEETVYPPILYQEAIRRALDAGIPLVIAQQALNRYYTVRGQRGRPKQSFQERQAAAKAAAAKRRKG